MPENTLAEAARALLEWLDASLWDELPPGDVIRAIREALAAHEQQDEPAGVWESIKRDAIARHANGASVDDAISGAYESARQMITEVAVVPRPLPAPTREQTWQAVASELACSCPPDTETGRKPPTKDGSHLANCPAGEVEYVVDAIMALLSGQATAGETDGGR
jgi:hypothetical protein